MKPAICVFLIAVSAFAQSDGITTFATRTVYVQPDQIEANIALTTPATVTQQQAANVLQTAGVASRLVSAASANGITLGRVLDRVASSFVYTFAYSISGFDMRDLAKKLETLQNTRSADYTSLSYSTALTVSQTVVDDQFQRVLPQMISDARKRAEVLAAAAGLKVGAVQNVTETASAAGAFLGSAIQGSGVTAPYSRTALTFSIAVKFAAN